MPMMAERVTPETARKAASNFLNNNGAKSAQLTDLSKAAGFANLYIFTAEQGFVVMAADDCVQPILGYSLTGKFVAENMPTNVSGWLQGYSDEIQWGIDQKVRATSETAKLWKDLIDGNSKAGKATPEVNNLLSTTWDQNPLYNNLCPYSNYYSQLTVTGCVATAMAQIMKYWGYPSSGIGSHTYTHTEYTENVVINGVMQEIYHDGMGVLSADFGATTYDWNNMPASLNSNSTEAQINAVATLMYHCGVSVEMDYGVASIGGSGAVTARVANALQTYFNYQTCTYKTKASYTENQWIQMLKDELDAGRPLQYSGRGTGGHSFVCCGYDSDNYFYFNWGWSGHNDAFFALNNLVPGSGGAGGGSYSFTNDQAAIFGIQPATLIDAPTNLTYTLSGQQDVTLNWNSASGASSYNVYRNGELVGNTTSTTFSETASYGNNSYYVRALDSNGQQSLPSNTVTFTIDYPTPIVTDLTATLSSNNANLSWTVPEWCYPETPSATLAIGTQQQSNTRVPWGDDVSYYWGHRHLAGTISGYDGMRLYSVDFHANNEGTYEICIYQGTSTSSWGYTIPTTQIASQTITVTNTGWNTVDFTSSVIIDGGQDLWVFVHNPEPIVGLSSYFCTAENNEGCYYTPDIIHYTQNTFTNWAFLIKTYVTDGTYTYNLYQDGNPIAQNISQTSYDANLNDKAANLFTVKTNYYGGETAASNAIGFAKGTASLSSLKLGENDKMTVTEGSQLTVSGTMSNDNAANLIIENGAQLIHNSEGVKATVKKEIAKYTVQGDDENLSNGWYLLASPMTENIEASTVNGLLTNDYDLYYFDQSQELEWRNYESTPQPFSTLDHKTGYLYANSGNTTLSFAGTLAATATATPLAYDANATTLKGFNLIGNPFACNATVERDFYVMNESMNEVTLAESGRQIAPCEGIFVQAKGENESVSFTKATASAKGTHPKDCFDVVVTQGRSAIDRTRVRLGEGIGMEKFSLDNNHTQISLWQDGQQLAVACANGENEMPLNFKAAKNGTYTLAFEVEKLDLDYLHLIDNMTGNEVDVLAMPTYTFAAKTTDYASRFRLVFSNCEDAIGDNDEDAPFAYVSNGEIRLLVETCQGASLQVVDMTGRVIRNCADVARNVSTSEMSPGVHVLRLIDGDNVRTQKIVIE